MRARHPCVGRVVAPAPDERRADEPTEYGQADRHDVGPAGVVREDHLGEENPDHEADDRAEKASEDGHA